MKDKIKLVQKLIRKAIEASDENYSVFVDYAPHTNGLGLRIFENGWKVKTQPDYTQTIYLDWDDAVYELESAIKSIRSEK